jgi:iron complex transport system permease protein
MVGVKKTLLLSFLFVLVFLAIALTSASLGPASIGFKRVVGILFSPLLPIQGDWSETEKVIVLSLRLPRIFLAALVGIALAVAGGVFQALLRNPLADPYILGVSSGSALGAVLALALGVEFSFLGFQGVSGFALAGGLTSIVLLYAIARTRGELGTLTTLLTGVILSAFFGSLLLFLVNFFPRVFLTGALSWLMGDLGMGVGRFSFGLAFYVLASFAFIYYYSRALNVLAMGDETAHHLGIEVARVKSLLLLAASLMTALAVSISGVIGFVGLIVPHAIRLVFGPDHRLLFPLSALVGASFLVGADTLARVALAPRELPVGVITALFGSPFFILILKRARMKELF